MKNKIRDLINIHYNSLINLYGFKSSKVMNYGSYENQVMRFMALSQISNLHNASILDVGCGLGDFSYFLKRQVKEFDYLGIDINDKMITAAKAKYPDCSFRTIDISLLKKFKPDYVFASGIFGLLLKNRPLSQKYFMDTITQMFKIAKKGIAFNVLNERFHPDKSAKTFSIDVTVLYEICLPISDKLVIRHDYLKHDITVYLYK